MVNKLDPNRVEPPRREREAGGGAAAVVDEYSDIYSDSDLDSTRSSSRYKRAYSVSASSSDVDFEEDPDYISASQIRSIVVRICDAQDNLLEELIKKCTSTRDRTPADTIKRIVKLSRLDRCQKVLI